MTDVKITGITESQKRTISAGSIAQIARMIQDDWSLRGKGVNFAAKPYLYAMLFLSTVDEDYGLDSGRSIVIYFLSNASSYRGDLARAVKVELKKRLK